MESRCSRKPNFSMFKRNLALLERFWTKQKGGGWWRKKEKKARKDFPLESQLWKRSSLWREAEVPIPHMNNSDHSLRPVMLPVFLQLCQRGRACTTNWANLVLVCKMWVKESPAGNEVAWAPRWVEVLLILTCWYNFKICSTTIPPKTSLYPVGSRNNFYLLVIFKQQDLMKAISWVRNFVLGLCLW